ncbi:MAG: hypothetical protein R2941_03165 [Desulfobacterales bacterium]
MKDKDAALEEEAFLIRHSGEIPEVTLHTSLYYLCQDPQGPKLVLTDADMDLLKDEVVNRYAEILCRDLKPENRDSSIYRGLARCIANWDRLARFCFREKRNLEALRKETARMLQKFLEQEQADVRSGLRTSCVNCPAEQVKKFSAQLDSSPHTLPAGWEKLCTEE